MDTGGGGGVPRVETSEQETRRRQEENRDRLMLELEVICVDTRIGVQLF